MLQTTRRSTAPPWRLLAALAVAAALVFAGCEPDAPDPQPPPATPPSPVVPQLAMTGMHFAAAQQADSFTVVSTWPPVVFHGDTIRTYRRTLTRVDTAQDLTADDNARIQAVGSETVRAASPAPGTTGDYRYCLRSESGAGVLSSDSTCAAFTFTNPDTVPPPPDSVDVDTQVALAVDSIVAYPKVVKTRPLRVLDTLPFRSVDTAVARNTVALSLHLPDPTWRESTTVVWRIWAMPEGTPDATRMDTYPQLPPIQTTAAIYYRGEVVGCSGACDTVPVAPALFQRHMPVAFRSRSGYPTSAGEWVPYRLPWFRQYQLPRTG